MNTTTKRHDAQDAAARAYIQEAAGTSTSTADELSRLADLRERGVIDEAEFQRLKANVIAPDARSVERRRCQVTLLGQRRICSSSSPHAVMVGSTG